MWTAARPGASRIKASDAFGGGKGVAGTAGNRHGVDGVENCLCKVDRPRDTIISREQYVHCIGCVISTSKLVNDLRRGEENAVRVAGVLPHEAARAMGVEIDGIE